MSVKFSLNHRQSGGIKFYFTILLFYFFLLIIYVCSILWIESGTSI